MCQSVHPSEAKDAEAIKMHIELNTATTAVPIVSGLKMDVVLIGTPMGVTGYLEETA